MHNKRKKGKNRASHSAARGGGINLAEFDGELLPEGGGTGGKLGVWGGPTVLRDRGTNIGGHPHNELPVASAFPGGELYLPTH